MENEPAGLGLSLDDLISSSSKQVRQEKQQRKPNNQDWTQGRKARGYQNRGEYRSEIRGKYREEYRGGYLIDYRDEYRGDYPDEHRGKGGKGGPARVSVLNRLAPRQYEDSLSWSEGWSDSWSDRLEGKGGRQGHVGKGGRAHGRGRGGGRDLHRYKQQEKLRQDPDTQDVIKTLYNTDIVVVKQTGEVTLDSGGFRTTQTRMSMNDALNTFGMKLVHNEADPSEWTVSDGKVFLKRYEDGMIIPAGQAGRGRGLALLKASGDPSATAAVQATEASDAAALAAGIVPRGAKGGRGKGGKGNRFAPY